MSVKIKIVKWLLLAGIGICLALVGGVHSQYLLDEEEKELKDIKEFEEKESIPEEKKAAPEEKKTTQEKKKSQPPALDDVDIILKRTFFKGLFSRAVKELQNFVARSDNKREVSKARLFIARSYIEMGRYRKALDLLILPEVKKYFPNDANFWESFALSRIKNH
ncbi:MAG: hypothetical protein A2W19_04980 [Spirochaetes bacterium RBG_16_49_21]|nr:MAG: hypothetical protein A2W19_04980 [Spirochaetes bacterium RBG_16_49_21]